MRDSGPERRRFDFNGHDGDIAFTRLQEALNGETDDDHEIRTALRDD